MRIVTIVGARPQFIKAAPVSAAIRRAHEEILVHTGQHHDAGMSDVFFAELNLPAPDHNLGVSGGRHGEMVARMLVGIERILLDARPDFVLLYGDTNSTLAGALAAAKLNIRVAHVEAGLRSFDRRMPEEINRVLVDRVSDLLLCPSPTAVANLAVEGITRGVHLVGDVMQDALVQGVDRASARQDLLRDLKLRPGGYVLATIHRAENTDDHGRLRAIAEGLSRLEEPVLLPLHPRTRAAAAAAGVVFDGAVRVIEPASFLDMLALEQAARVIVTDSGGIQKEAYWLGIPCLTIRTTTEWVETVETGWNRLVGADAVEIVGAVRASTRPAARPPIYGEIGASERIAAVLDAASRVH